MTDLLANDAARIAMMVLLFVAVAAVPVTSCPMPDYESMTPAVPGFRW